MLFICYARRESPASPLGKRTQDGTFSEDFGKEHATSDEMRWNFFFAVLRAELEKRNDDQTTSQAGDGIR